MHITMTAANHDMIVDLLCAAYGVVHDDDILKMSEAVVGIPEYSWTPTQIIQLSVEVRDVQECIRVLATE
jgi:hypothetical protein